MRQRDFHGPRTCARCGVEFSADEVTASIGWTPVRSGWRCPDCSRAYAARVAALAERLLRDHQRCDWLGTAEHSAWDECLFCDTLTAAAARVLNAPVSQR